VYILIARYKLRITVVNVGWIPSQKELLTNNLKKKRMKRKRKKKELVCEWVWPKYHTYDKKFLFPPPMFLYHPPGLGPLFHPLFKV
jgi:hypothetical protein